MPDDAIVIQSRPVSADDRNGVQMQRIIDGDSVSAAVTVLPVPPGGTFLPAGNVNTRRQTALFNAGAVDAEINPGSLVAWGSGFPLPAGAAFSTNYSGTIFARTNVGTADLRLWGEA
jgi:hypothetical protein